MSNSPRRALIVIDVQHEYLGGNLPIEYPDVQQSLGNIARAMDAAHAQDMPIVLVQQLAPADSPLFPRGSYNAALHPTVAERPHDLRLEKSLPSALAATELGQWLRARDVDTLTVVGYMTHNCNDSTIRQAVHEGWQVEYLHDASGSVSYRNRAGAASAEDIHRVFCVVLQSRFAAVMSTDEWLQILKSGARPERDNIYQSNQRARS
ncbi:cysteine hydrolase family protein [Pseudomonas zhanjiangensis]|uniref:Cysteine hydrolase family protein n=1 Tax=Pseudomonas zhanjiangensis TaxID=3239015 RepID=A0ABV3YTZ0_9PSED